MRLSYLLLLLLLVFLTACNPSSSEIPSPEATELSTEAVLVESTIPAEETEIAYQFELTERHSSPMAWGGRASFGYPSDWRVNDTSEGQFVGRITIYGVDGYTFSIAINNDPSNTESTLRTVLDRLNQNNPIESIEYNGQEVIYSRTRGGNGLGVATYVEGTIYSFVELVSVRNRELEPMYETAFQIVTSVEIAPEVGE